MVSSTITSKGQTTIPLAIRNFLSLHVGDRIDFIPQKDGKVLLSPAKIDVSELKGILPKPKKPVSIEEMNAAIRKRGGKL